MTNATTIANYLLEEEDSPALLTLAYWYGRVCQSRYWWMLRRARLAELAICDLLEGTWGGKENGNGRLLELVKSPKAMLEHRQQPTLVERSPASINSVLLVLGLESVSACYCHRNS
jgi:hypothetical protein